MNVAKSDPSEKTLRPGERRYIAKESGEGRQRHWGVYDKARASWPVVMHPPLGKVKQNHGKGKDGETSAKTEADRLEGLR